MKLIGNKEKGYRLVSSFETKVKETEKTGKPQNETNGEVEAAKRKEGK